jgi:hypothetical protein
MTETSRTSAKNCSSRFLVESPCPTAVGKTQLSGGPNHAPVDRKTTNKEGREAGRPPKWDFKRHGLLFEADVQEALKLKSESPAAFKSSDRAQAIVAWSERSLRWQIALGRAIAEGIPQPFRDLWIAKDRKRKPKERLAAIERFACLFNRIPMNVGIALFDWPNGGSKLEVVKALDTVVTLKMDPKTGDLAEADGRGRKKSPATARRIELAAQRRNDGISQRKMATELFPHLYQEQAYTRTRDFFLKNRYAIERVRYRLRHQQSSPKSPR